MNNEFFRASTGSIMAFMCEALRIFKIYAENVAIIFHLSVNLQLVHFGVQILIENNLNLNGVLQK